MVVKEKRELRDEEGEREGGGVRWSGQKIGHKINSIQPAECSLLLGSNISRRSPLRGRVGSFSRGRTQQWNPLPCPRCPEPASIHHHSYWKKRPGAPLRRAQRLRGTAELSRHPGYSALSISRTLYREITRLVRK